MKPRKLTGIILDSEPRGEFDKLISVFTYECGLVNLIAKGVKRIKSRRASHLDLFNCVKMETEEYGNGASNPRYLRETSTLQSFPNLQKQPMNFGAACVVASFLIRNIQKEYPQKAMFKLTHDTLAALGGNKEPKQTLLAFFLKAMRLLGYLPPRIHRHKMRSSLAKTLSDLDPQFALNARRTLGIFSSLDNTRSS